MRAWTSEGNGGRARDAVRRLGAAFALLCLAAVPAAGGEEDGPLVLHAYTLEHQPASEAVALIYEHLSARGTVELQPGGNTLVIRDTLPALRRILPVLSGYDHPARRLSLTILVVRARSAEGGDEARERASLPPELAQRLRGLLRYERFELVASADLETREGEEVGYRVGDDYAVGFRLGTIRDRRRLRLSDFRLDRDVEEPEPERLLETHLNLWLDEPMVLGLAPDEAADQALMVILTVALGDGEAQVPPGVATAGGEER